MAFGHNILLEKENSSEKNASENNSLPTGFFDDSNQDLM